MIKPQSIEVVLAVPSVEDTLVWYQRVLGWPGMMDVFDAQGRCDFGCVECNPEKQLGLNISRDKGDPAVYSNSSANANLLIYVEDVDVLYSQVVAAGEQPDSEPKNQFWGGRTFFLKDLNGFGITFATLVEQPDPEELRSRYAELAR